MPDNIFEKVKSTINIADVVERFGVKLDRNDKALCPFHNEDTPSFSVKRSDNIFKCFGCNKSGDAIDFVSSIKGIDSLDAAKLLADIYGISQPQPQGKKAASNAVQKATKPPCVPKQNHKQDIKKYIAECRANIGQTDYFARRGLSEDIIKHFHLGYDPQKRRVVIPYSSGLSYYQTRSVDGKEFRKPPTEQAGQEPLFNPAVLQKGGAVFVVESPICAMSIMQCGGLSVALCGTGGQKLISEIKSKKPKCSFILSLDNDKPGQEAQADLARELHEMNVKFMPFNVMEECNDPNELHVKDAGRLVENIKDALAAVKDKYRTDQDAISFAELCKKKLPPLRWAIKGLFPEGLHMIASMPKVGKSWMALGMCFAVANGGNYLGYTTTKMGTLYYSLEDNYNSAQGRMLDYAKAIGSPPPDNAYLAIDAERTDTGFFAKLKQELTEHPDIGFVVVDTLQNIRGAELKKGDVYGNDVGELKRIKRFAIENRLVIVLVHHLRKAKDDGDPFNNILGSNGLWGTVDTGITLTKKNEEDLEAKMRFKGRGIKPGSLIIELRNSCCWEIVGTPEEQEVLKKKSEYEDNPIIKTIKWLLSKAPYTWTGTPTDLMMASYDMDGIARAITQESIGKTINKNKMDLYYDGICTEEKRTSKKRLYTFYKKALRPMQYQIKYGDDK